MQSQVNQGVSIIYISHRMEELFQICHRVTVLRDGEFIATCDIAGTSIDQLVALKDFMPSATMKKHPPERIKTNRYKILVYSISGLLAGLAGAILI